jgi:glutamate 5-kinase
MIIADAHEQEVLTRILKGEELGTLVKASKTGYTNKERWIRFSKSHGRVKIDRGARDALLRGANLLPSGILKVEGKFNAGDVVSIAHGNREIAKGIVDYSSEELSKIKGKQTGEIEKILGYKNYDNVFRRENMAFI